ncbi:MAG: uroporphyrinogen-III C-methyltransferase [Rhizobiaceae bacterium]
MSLDFQISQLPFQPAEFVPGHVWLAGAGPGSIGHLTLDVLDAVSKADVIIYDALVNPDILKLAKDAKLCFAGKRGGKVSAAQDAINEMLIGNARQNRRVLRLKGGDPYIFGRGGEEVFVLARAGIPFRVLPGITAAFAALAATDIPATIRGTNRAIILATGHAPGTDGDVDWTALAKTGQPIIVYMGLSNVDRIATELIAGGMAADTPAAIIQSATTNEERVLIATASTIAAEAGAGGYSSPALIVFGDIVALRSQLQTGATSEVMP